MSARACLTVVVLSAAAAARADELPVALQAQLLSKTSTYITSLTPGAGGGVKVLVVSPTAAASRGAESLSKALGSMGQVGRFKLTAVVAPFAGAKEFQATLAAEKPQVVWLAPELDEKAVSGVVEAAGPGVVTVSAVSSHVSQGVILGFSMAEGKPSILVNLKQARARSVVFLSGLLTHSVIVEK